MTITLIDGKVATNRIHNDGNNHKVPNDVFIRMA
eukprot:CAMPEP_0170075416 /NCGR_PEP_ID=MMETSP0019_2-20121128/12556_1 /TAXON_ID=98059 /ORGANISM="Dinobryon sp., Strain UTEXLB2267" /LENGTH=33 /DNA_ID= /DNA_START= /DNA_END= /DNA_ORIENTATION=